MNIFSKIFVLLWFWFRLAVRGVIDMVFTLASPLLLTLIVLAGYDLKAFERKYMDWLFYGEFKDE